MLPRSTSCDDEAHPGGPSCHEDKVRRRFLKMPKKLSELSRRFQMLTTDAKPDPPRVEIEGYTHNLPPSPEEETKTKTKTKSKSVPDTRETDRVHSEERPTVERQNSVPNGAVPTIDEDFQTKDRDIGDTEPSPTDFGEQKGPGVKTRAKFRHSKHPHPPNVVSYNIINSNGVKIGPSTSYICNVNQYPANKSAHRDDATPKSRQMPESVQSLTACTDEITFEDMFVVKTHVGHGWRDIARRLSYSDGQIEQFEENHRHKGIDEVIYQLLLDWHQTNAKDAQIGCLVQVLWSCQEYDCAERLVAARKDVS